MIDIQCEFEAIPRTDHLHVNVQRHCMGRKNGNDDLCIGNSQIVAECAKTNRARTLVVFLGLDQKRNGTELTRTSRIENGIVSLRT